MKKNWILFQATWKKAFALVMAMGLTGIAIAQLPNPGMKIDPANTALVITDPQNDFLSPDGVAWGVVGESVKKNGTVENLDDLF